jgi:hypothetical protein
LRSKSERMIPALAHESQVELEELLEIA